MPPIQKPAPVAVPVTTTTIPLSQIDRAPAPVQLANDPGLETPAPAVPVTLPVAEQPVPSTPAATVTATVPVSQPSYLAVDDEGSLVLARTTVLNFTGNGVTVTASGSTANVIITAGAGSYGNANVTALLSSLGSNTVSTTGNVTAGNLAVTGGSLTWSNAGIVQTSASDLSITGDGQVTVRSLDGTYQWTFDSNGNLTAPGNISTSATVTGGNLQTSGLISATGNVTGNYFIGNGSQLTGIAASYGDSNVTTLLGNLGNNPVSTTGNITGGTVIGNIQAPDGNGSVLINVNGIIGAAAGFSYDTAANALFAPTITGDGHPETGVNALYAGVGGYTVLGSAVVVQLTSNVDGYSQINQQNINSGSLASGDYIITADNGTDSTYYLDIGMASSNHADPDFFGDTSTVNDGYFYVTGADQAGPSGGVGNLIVGSTNGVIKLFVGNTAQANVIATVESTGLTVNTGNLTLPRGGVVYETNIPFGGLSGNTIALAPSGGTNADQQLLVYPTAGADANHLHLTSGNLYNTELFVGDDNLYVKLANTGNIVINSNDGTGNSAQWTFGTDGNLILAGGNSVIQSIANSSLDPLNANVSTMVLTPDANYNSQVLVLDPTSPGHIHLRALAFGNIDEPAANLFLGGETTAFEITYGPGSEAKIHSGGNSWTFANDGNITTPQGMVVSGNVNFLGTDTALLNPANNVPLSLISSGANGTVTSYWAEDIGNVMTSNIAAIYVPLQGTGNVRIVTGNNSGNVAIYDFDNAGVFTTANVSATYAYGNTIEANVFVGGTANISGNVLAGNVIVTSSIVGSGASPAPTLSGFSTISTSGAQGNITAAGNLIANAAVIATGNVSGGNIITGGLISATGNITANYVIGNGSQLTSVNAAVVDITDTNGLSTTYYPTFVENRNTGQIVRADVDLTYRTDINMLTVGNITAGVSVTTPVAFANLTAVSGARAFCNDANLIATGNFGSQISGSGSNTVPVWSDGTNWYIG